MMEHELLTSAIGKEEYSLRQFHYWLKYEGLTFLGGGFSVWVPYGYVVMILAGLAAIFTPYMLWQLVQAKSYTSIAVFVAVVLLPFAGSFFVSSSEAYLTKFLLMSVPLAIFYIYCWVLRLVLGEHLSELEMVRMINYKRHQNPS